MMKKIAQKVKSVGIVFFVIGSLIIFTLLMHGGFQEANAVESPSLDENGSFLTYLPVAYTPGGPLAIELVPFAQGVDYITNITHAGDDRLFVTEKDGRILIINGNGTINTIPFLDISDQVESTPFEAGLLGLAMHPNYSENGYFYIYYMNHQAQTVVSRFQKADGDPNIADPNSELILLMIEQPADRHQAGAMQFGPLDGYLYIAVGDGGNNSAVAQDIGSDLGKILRIDVDSGSPYSIPADNPFVGVEGAFEETWVYGLRNPWRISFDRDTGDLYIGDVGGLEREEIDFKPASSSGGENYGFPCYEGSLERNVELCKGESDLVFPIFEYEHDERCASVIGGFVYRGDKYPELFGRYLFGDLCQKTIWSLTDSGDGVWEREALATFSWPLTTFGEGADGELYAAGASHDTIYHIVPATE